MAQITVQADFTLDELLAQVAEPAVREGFYTAGEWAAHFGVSGRRIMGILHAAKAAGRLVVDRASRESLDGKRQPVPVYRILPAQGSN